MTTLRHSLDADEIFQQLAAVRSRRWVVQMLAGLVAMVCIVAGSLVILAGAAGYWPGQPPPALRWTLLAAACGVWTAAAAWFLLRAAVWRQNPAQIARYVEQKMPHLGNNLINSVLLWRDDRQAGGELVGCAIAEAARQTRTTDVAASVSLKPIKRWAVAAGLSLALLATFATLQPGQFRRGVYAALSPGRHVPNFGGVRLGEIIPGDATCFVGERLTIVARVHNKAARPLEAQLLIEGDDTARPMAAGDGYSTFTCSLGKVNESFRYAVCVGDSRWPADADYRPYYTVAVLQRVEVAGLDLRYTYPPYTHIKAVTVRDSDGEIEAPAGSSVHVTLRLAHPAGGATLLMGGAAPLAMRPAPDSRSFEATLPVSRDGAYRLELRDRTGRALRRLPDLSDGAPPPMNGNGPNVPADCYAIRAIPDAAPRIAFSSPNRNVTISPDGKLAVEILASDDYALTAVTLLAAPEGSPAEAIHSFDVTATCLGEVKRSPKRRQRFAYTFDLGDYAEGTTIVYRAAGSDNRRLPGLSQGPQTAATREFKILIRSAARGAGESARLYEQLRSRLLAILKIQEAQRLNTEICLRKHTQIAAIAGSAGRIVAGQGQILGEFLDLQKNFRFDDATALIQEVIAATAVNQAPLAVEQAKVLAGLKSLDGRGGSARPLAATQDEIIDHLHSMLAILPSLIRRDSPADNAGWGEDLPPDVREKLAQLKADLERFIDAQRKIVQSSRRLVKKPADTFTNDDEKLLADLQVLQDKWEKFINEQFTDFSKLVAQDMSNPVLLKELMSIKSDVTMARNALANKAVEIATALENNGVENAETLTANIEKWLMDEPDRKKWSMEDPAWQENFEQADLPSELEDLVGDLLEEEEDLFDEMDDLTGKYGMSGDKGIGWDAMDGPISSMNAQGVTGNALPNTNEMSGRSGEGRTGKSSGEFVEDKAVGKGGRRTPTRLTGDAFQAGQIKDTSQDSPGGATGGGKVSGSGAEGLEGPVPPPLAAEMKRLAGRQAVLVNRAERLRQRFSTNDYANFQLLKTITLMNRVRNDLANHRYVNVLRSRHVTLASLQRTGEILSGAVHVTADNSSAMPKYVRREIADAMKGNLPAEYRRVLEQYYRRLSAEAYE